MRNCLDIEAALVASVRVGRKRTLAKEYSWIHNELDKRNGIGTYISRPHPGDFIVVNSRFTKQVRVGDIIPFGINMSEEFELNHEDYEVVIALGETTRRESGRMHFSGQHIKNARSVYEMLTTSERDKLVLDSDYKQYPFPVIVTGVPEIDMFIHIVRTRLNRYYETVPNCPGKNINESIAKIIEAVRSWLNETARQEVLRDSKQLGYKVVKNQDSLHLFEEVIFKANELNDVIKEWLNSGSAPGREGIANDILALNDAIEALREASDWRVMGKRYAESDREPDAPEATPRSFWDTMVDMEKENTSQIEAIEGTNRILVGFALPTVGLAIGLLNDFSKQRILMLLVAFAIGLHFVSVLVSLILLGLSGIRRTATFKKDENKKPLFKGIDHLHENEAQRGNYGYEEELFYDLYHHANIASCIDVKNSSRVILSLKSLTRSAHALYRLALWGKIAIILYSATVFSYALSALIYFLMWFPTS